MMARDGQLQPVEAIDHKWLFPTALYGTQANVRKFTRKCARSAVTKGTWRDEWREVATQSVLDVPGDLFVSDSTGWYRASESVWRLNRVWIDLQAECHEQKRYTLYPALVDEMLNELWFCMAMLGSDSPLGFYVDPDSPVAMTSNRRMISAIVAWLPEIMILSARISNLVSSELASHLGKIPSYRYQWAYGLLNLCRRCGHPVEIPIDVEDEEWNLAEELVREGIVRPIQGRWESCL
jgi:hypothetical protein